MIFLGDIHGKIECAHKICAQHPGEMVVQVGDFGVGFIPTEKILKDFPANLKFFVGNHDSRQEAKKIPGCLGDFGEFENFFFVSGAKSTDKDIRIPGMSWWHDEELGYKQADDCLEAWIGSGKKILVAHDTSYSFAKNHLKIGDYSSTRHLLEDMIILRKPKMMIFGHHHNTIRKSYGGIQYIGLGIGEVFKI